MLVYTDSVDYARIVLGRTADLWSALASELSDDLRSLMEGAYGAREIRESTVHVGSQWQHLILVEVADRSHYDLLIELSRAGVRLPDRVLCLLPETASRCRASGYQLHGSCSGFRGGRD
jgi:hypothetical protein